MTDASATANSGCLTANSCAAIADVWPAFDHAVSASTLALTAILLLLAVLAVACAVWIALRRDPWLALRARQPQPDPLAEVHGDVPTLDFLSATAPPRNSPATGAATAGGRTIPSCAPAGHVRDGGER